MEPCTHQDSIEGWKRDIPKLLNNNAVFKTRWVIISGGFSILLAMGVLFANLNDRATARAQEKSDAALMKVEKESKEKDKEHDKDIQIIQVAIGKMEVNAQRIEEKVDAFLEESNKKQEDILDAIKDLKEYSDDR